MKRFSPQANILLNCSESFHTTLKKKKFLNIVNLQLSGIHINCCIADQTLLRPSYAEAHSVPQRERGVLHISEKCDTVQAVHSQRTVAWCQCVSMYLKAPARPKEKAIRWLDCFRFGESQLT